MRLASDQVEGQVVITDKTESGTSNIEKAGRIGPNISKATDGDSNLDNVGQGSAKGSKHGDKDVERAEPVHHCATIHSMPPRSVPVEEEPEM